MKADAAFASALEQYKEEVSRGGVKITIPEINMEFYVFPVQASERLFYTKGVEDIDDFVFLYRLIASRAKDEHGFPYFDSIVERDKWLDMAMRKMPSSMTITVVSRVLNEILTAFETTSIEDATKN